MRKLFLLFFTLLSGICLAAELSLPTVFSDHMVLQRERAVPVWGKADAGATVTVEFAGQKKTTTAGADGKWRVDLAPLAASSEPRELKVSSNLKSEIVNRKFADVLVGEVWLCSGQSNMQMPLKGFKIPTDKAATDIPAANIPLLRLYKTPQVAAGVPKERIDAVWTTCTPATAAEFSAAAFYFGRKLQNDLKVPVGLLQSAWGGTRIEPWTPPCGFQSIGTLNALYQQSITLTTATNVYAQTPAALYNGMLYAHIPFAIRGAIWYQGESNHSEGMLYVDKTRALLNGWRKLWGYEFPFYFVQIAPYRYGSEDPSVLPVFWEAQAEIVKQISNTGMAVITDCTLLDDIHPTNKEAPGTRLALLAEANTYGMKGISTGPMFKSMDIQKGALKVTFDAAEGLTTRDGKAPDWFELTGKDGIFKPSDAKIEGGSVILSSPEVPEPVAMRFAWNKLATPNLVNKAGLPTATFRAGKVPEPKVADPVKISEMDGYRIVYQINIPANADYSTLPPKYEIDNSAKTAPFTKVAYMIELQKIGGEVQYAFASMDAFTDDVSKIGIPTAASGAKFMEQVKNLTVRSNVAGIIPCTDSDGGNIEFWPGNYSQPNAKNIPGANAQIFDFGDNPNDKIPGYGSMQVHNWKEKQTVFAINHWGLAGTIDTGIGNSSSDKRSTDWTFVGNGGDYVLRRLTVLVK
jgi:sialate O-acetylesterase